MVLIAVAIVILVVAMLILVALRQEAPAASNGHPYQMEKALFTPAERSFFGVLSQVVGDRAQVLGKVRVADVITPKKGLSRSDWQKAFNKISAKHFDFLICNKDDLSVLCAVELNDSSHASKSRQQRDRLLDGACQSAGLPLIQVPARAAYVLAEIRGLVAPYVGGLEVPQPAAHGSNEPERSEETKSCPKCASPLVRRVAKRGEKSGEPFLGCSAFPKCKYTEALYPAAPLK